MQNQDLYGPGLNSNSQRVLVQPPNHLNQSMSSYSFVRYQPNNSVQLMANTHLPPQTSSLALSPQVQSWNSSCEQSLQNSHIQPVHHQSQQQISQQQIQQHTRLKVEDALSYLDQVKLKFGHQPQVYNEFLDIMKEFKSQVIDTPGVIRKVSMLFQGHTELIVGFNTFLPQGYSIEVKENQTINVRQPGQQVVPLTNFNTPNNVQGHTPSVLQTSQPQNVRQNAAEISQNLNQFATNQGQPVQFNHAINYVNKIKSCYQGRPEIYKAFLEILHNYQKEQKNLKEGARQAGNRAPVTEAEVYAQVSLLFSDQPELLMEFRQFLPDANGGNELMRGLGVQEGFSSCNQDSQFPHRIPANQTSLQSAKPPLQSKGNVGINSPIRSKSSSVTSSAPPAKRQKLSFQKSSPREPFDGIDFACHYIELTKIVNKMLLYYPSRVVQCREFLKHVETLNRKAIDASEFYRLALPLIEKSPELKHYVKNVFLKNYVSITSDKQLASPEKLKDLERNEKEWFPDLSTCPQYGKHYRMLPIDYVCEKSSNASELCRKVLNETHSIYATPLSDTESDCDHNPKRNFYEEHVFQCEDERYELDMVIDLNSSVLKGLKKLMPKIQKMGSEDLAKFHIDDLSCAIGVSEVHIETALKRLYGEKFRTMVEGLKKCPGTAVPIVIRSLQAKDKEWKMAKKSFERVWSEQMDKFYLKSLDFQGLKFKQNDIKNIRSKSLIKEIENLYNDQIVEGLQDCVVNGDNRTKVRDAKGLKLTCKDRALYDDATMLILSSISRQSAVQVEDQDKIKNVLVNFLPSIIFLNQKSVAAKESFCTHKEFSDGECNGEEDFNKKVTNRPKVKVKMEVPDDKEYLMGGSGHVLGSLQNTSFYCNDNWYILVRLLVVLCERLYVFKEKAQELSKGEQIYKGLRSKAMTSALQARCPESLDPCSYYATFLTMVKNLTNGFLELSTFEDQLREMFGINSYVAFTIDKLIHSIIKQLQHVISKNECVLLRVHYESASKQDLTMEQYEQKALSLMASKMCFKLNVEKDINGLVELVYSLIQLMPKDSNSSYAYHKNPTAAIQISSTVAKNVMSDNLNNLCLEASSALCEQDMKSRKRRRKSSEVRTNISRVFGLNESSYSYRNVPDFVRKLKQDRRFIQRPEVTPQNCLVQALESMASSHPNAVVSPHHRSDYDNDAADNCLNEESSDGSQRMLHDKNGDKSEDDSSCSGSYQRVFPRLGCTEIHVCRPGCIEKARKINCKIRMTRMKKFDKWKKKWDSNHLNDDPSCGLRETFIGTSTFGLITVPTYNVSQQFNSIQSSSLSPQSNNLNVISSPEYSLRGPSPCLTFPKDNLMSPLSPSHQLSDQLHKKFQSVGNENDLSMS